MLVGEHSALLSTFIKLPIVIKIFVLSIIDWPFYTGGRLTHVLLYKRWRQEKKIVALITSWGERANQGDLSMR